MKKGALDANVSYIIEGDINISGESALTLRNVTVNGNVTVSEDSRDIIIYRCNVSVDIICAATDAVIIPIQSEY